MRGKGTTDVRTNIVKLLLCTGRSEWRKAALHKSIQITLFSSFFSVPLSLLLLQLSGRELIGRTLTKSAERVYNIFSEQLDAVKRVFNNFRGNPPLFPTWPRLAGAGLWARLLKKQIDHSKDALTRAYFLPPSNAQEEVRHKC